MNRGIPGSIGDPIGDHWLGDFDHHPMPTLADGTSFVCLMSLRASSVLDLASRVSRERLYFPWLFDSDWGMGVSFMRYSAKGIEVLTDLDAKSYRADRPLPARPLEVVPVSPAEAEDVEPRIIIGGHPVGDLFGAVLPMYCWLCSAQMSFVLQLASSLHSLGFSVWDGETLYYGWCDHCGVLGVEANTS